jgi:hypothetical protein
MSASLRSKITFAGFAVAATLGLGLGTGLGELAGWFEVVDEPPQAQATRRRTDRRQVVRCTVAGA